MKMAIAIQCHNKPEIINELIKFFNDCDIDIYIHVDKKSNIYNKLLINTNVYMIKNRIDVQWGKFSQVEATLEMFKLIIESKKKYNYVHLISGQDFMVKNINGFKNMFRNNNKEYLEHSELPNEWPKGGIDRYKVYYPNWMIDRPKNLYKRMVRIAYREVILKTKILQRSFTFYKYVYGGSSWFSITGECLEYIMNYLKNNNEYYEFFKNSLCPDEIFFHTLIMNSPFAKNVENNNLRYIDWSVKNMGSPKQLNKNDIDLAIESNNIFARKIENLEECKYITEQLKEG